MAELHGKSGSISLAGTAMAGINDWSMSLSISADEVTNFSDVGVKRFVPGINGWKGQAKGFLLSGTPIYSALQFTNQSIAITLSETSATGQAYSGFAVITDFAVAQTSSKVGTVSLTFQGTGALYAPTA